MRIPPPVRGWHFSDDEFVGLHWFLWAGQPWNSVVEPAAEQLKQLVCRFAGPPNEEITAAPSSRGFTALWTINGRTIDMYAHGPTNVDGTEDERGTAVQLHIDDSGRSARAEARTQAQQSARPTTLN